MDVLYTGPNRKEEKEREIGAKYVDLDTLLKNADFITINAAYNPNVLFNRAQEFKMMKSTVYLINASAWSNRARTSTSASIEAINEIEPAPWT